MDKTVFILGISSDIGKELAKYYIEDGYSVVGTYRNIETVRDFIQKQNMHLLHYDVSETESTQLFVTQYCALSKPWDIFISCIGTMEPIGNFFDCNFSEWEQSVITNSIAQLRVLHELYPHRNQKNISNVVFFAGGGTNGPFKNYSAYCVSKIMLIKMCELLDDEDDDMNIFIVGPGWVRTKIHQQTLNNPECAGQNYKKTVAFIDSNISGTSDKDIYDCINWCIVQGKWTISGRNFSVVHDPWKRGGLELAEQLRNNPDKFKLRRFKNTE